MPSKPEYGRDQVNGCTCVECMALKLEVLEHHPSDYFHVYRQKILVRGWVGPGNFSKVEKAFMQKHSKWYQAASARGKLNVSNLAQPGGPNEGKYEVST